MYDCGKHPRHFVYALLDPIDLAVRYIGRSSTGPARPIEHATRVNRERTHKAAWIRSLLRRGLTYRIVVLEICHSVEDAVAAEIRWITDGRAIGWALTNHTGGGEGASRKKLALPSQEIVQRYLDGESEKKLADHFGVQRWTIRRRLVEAGVAIRGRVFPIIGFTRR